MAAKPTQFKPIIPVPEGTPAPPQRHPNRGEPVRRFPYYLSDGTFAGWSCEFSDSSGLPVFLPLTWTQDTQPPHDLMWRWQAMPEPRPLYGLMDLLGDAGLDSGHAAPVLLFPTEAGADLARASLSGVVLDGEAAAFPCLSWYGGPNCALKNDWSAIKNRPVWIWPGYSCQRKRLSPFEAESGELAESKPFLPEKRQPGFMAAAKIAEILTQQGCTVMVLELPEIGVYKEGWGVADVIADGITGQTLFDFIRVRVKPFSPAKFGTDKAAKGANLPVEGLSTPQQACAKPLENAAHTEAQAGANPAGAGSVETEDVDWKWKARLKGGKAEPFDCRENVRLFLGNHPELAGMVWADEFSRKIVMRKPAPWEEKKGFVERQWSQIDDFELGDWLMHHANLAIHSKNTINDAVTWEAGRNKYFPPLEYCESLQWDGVSRLNDWLTDFLGVEKTEYSQCVGRFWMIGLVARIYKPGCTNRFMPILEGLQYRGKSSALRILGGPWFGDTPLDHKNKDQYQNIQGCLIYEIAELDSFNRAEATSMKAFISSQSDRFRAPYEASPRDYPRTTVFVGTTNQNAYFKDSTGNTRYWPLTTEAIGEINLEGLTNARDMLFAEAVVRYKRDEHWWPTADEQRDLFQTEQECREIPEAWDEAIESYLIGKYSVSMNEIIQDCLKIEIGKVGLSRGEATRIGIIIKKCNWEADRSMKSGKRARRYHPKKDTANAQTDDLSHDDMF